MYTPFHLCPMPTRSEPTVTLLCMWGLMGDIIAHAQYQLNQFRGYKATVPTISLFPIHSHYDPHKQLSLPCYRPTVL